MSIQLHSFVAIMYFIDIVRRHSHPHSWILNTPFFVAWILDHVIGAYWRRLTPTVFRKRLSENYMVLFWKGAATPQSHVSVAPKYFLKHKDSSWTERSHVFTALENRVEADLAEGTEWPTCLVVRIYNSKRLVRLPRQDKTSHTSKVASATDIDVYAWGPFHSNISEKLRGQLENPSSVIIVGGGSAAGFVIDALQYHLVTKVAQLTVLYTARDDALISWMVSAIRLMEQKVSFDGVQIWLAQTGTVQSDTGSAASTVDLTTEHSFMQKSTEVEINLQHNRLDFEKRIVPGSVVFAEGSASLENAVRRSCKLNQAKLYSGPPFDGENSEKKWIPNMFNKNIFRTKAIVV